MVFESMTKRSKAEAVHQEAPTKPAEEKRGHVPDPEVGEMATRRQFTAEYKARVLREIDDCPEGSIGAILRREGLYSSHIATWRRQRSEGQLQGLTPRKRGPKAQQRKDPVALENVKLRREAERLTRRLEQAERIIEIQKKVSELLGLPLPTIERDEIDS